MSSPAGSTRSNINSMTGALAPRTRSGATYGSGAAAPSTPVRGPALRLVDPADAALRRASADVPSFLEQAEGTVPQGALQRSAGLTADLGQLFEALEHGFPGYEHPVHYSHIDTFMHDLLEVIADDTNDVRPVLVEQLVTDFDRLANRVFDAEAAHEHAVQSGAGDVQAFRRSEADSARDPFSLHFVLVWMVNHGFVPASVSMLAVRDATVYDDLQLLRVRDLLSSDPARLTTILNDMQAFHSQHLADGDVGMATEEAIRAAKAASGQNQCEPQWSVLAV